MKKKIINGIFYSSAGSFWWGVIGVFYFNEVVIIIAVWITLLIMGIGSIGITKNLLSKNQVKCACLGTKIKIPLTKFTLIENIIMVIMAAIIIFA